MMDEQKEKQMNTDVVDTRDEPVEQERREEQVSEKTSTISIKDELSPLFEEEAAEKFRTRWFSIQSKFVDDPADSVKQADELVADVIQDITRSFADRRGSLERQWTGGEKASTEDLRIALKQYRSFFERLLTLQS